jgi:hypothetical protein
METNKENQVNNIKAKPTVARYILVAVSTILLWGLFYLLLVVGVFIVVTFRRYGLIPMEAFFTVIGIRNLIKWEREK